ncbi:MAG TPA: ABC transporter ATP-binding protein [Gaiellaceae bacterium]|jgi:ABC-type Fe3+/spermidine/putrescine transport system ATPase subunit|nr:ABC transporter ATP-binding protein [Gaiellaceae bacterium]
MSAGGLLIERVSKDLGGRTIVDDLDLEVRQGELTCLLGPSGCGKTTTLRMIGGFLHPDRGRIVIDGQDLGDRPPERRPTAMVFQNYALWPHMTVFKNVAFGLKLRKLPKREIEERVAGVLELVGLTHHTHSYPARISGGEQQRVALARSLVLEPTVLLLDEPLSNLDAKLRVRVREEIREIQQRIGITTVFVTHDQDEALSIADRIAVMSGGKVEQYADARGLYREPATMFVANFVGTMNVYSGTLAPDGVALGGSLVVPCEGLSSRGEGEWEIGVRPEDVQVSTDGAGAEASVVREVPRGHYKELVLRAGEHEIRAFVAADLPAAERMRVSFTRALLYRDGVLQRAPDAAVAR